MSINRPFDRLKKQLKKAAANARPGPPAPAAPNILPDKDLFTDAMSDVREIDAFRSLSCRRHAKRETGDRPGKDPDRDALRLLRQIAHGELPINLPDTQEYIEWTNPAFRQGLAKDLHAGRFSVQSTLDLHGSTGDEVRGEMDRFLDEAFKRGYRCVKIIVGRGLRSVKRPVLKEAVVRRLSGRFRKHVIAFVSAPQFDGGLGALYVLLIR